MTLMERFEVSLQNSGVNIYVDKMIEEWHKLSYMKGCLENMKTDI